MKYIILLLIIVGIFTIPNMSDNALVFGAATAGKYFCNAFPTHPECTGWRVEPISDNFWFCQYVDLPTMCDNPPDPDKQIIPRTGNHCCGIIGSHTPKNISIGDVQFAGISERGQSLDASSTAAQELAIWTQKDHYFLGDRVNVYGKFNFDDPVLKNNNPFVDIKINDRKVVLDLPVHSNGWFAGYFTLSNPYLYYTGYNLISVEYFHTPTQHEPDKFTTASYTITTGDVVASESFSIKDKSSSGKMSYEIVSESNDPVNLNFATIRIETPDGLVFALPNVSTVNDVSNHLDVDNDVVSLIPGKYEITVTKGNHVVTQEFEYVE